jgi:hypothetical protein
MKKARRRREKEGICEDEEEIKEEGSGVLRNEQKKN